MKKGSEISRYTSAKNEKLKGRTYASMNKSDDDTNYEDMAKRGVLGSKSKTQYKDVYSAERKLTVVKGKRVANSIINKYGDKDLKEILDKKVRLTFDMSERVVKIALLEDEIDIKELNLGIFAGFTAMSSGKTTNNKIEIIQNGKKKAYNTSITSV